MSTIIQGDELRTLNLGRGVASKAIPTLSGTTFQLFTVAGGEVLITALWGVVTTSITTNGGTLNLQTDPTAGDTVVVVTATDLGTTDSVAGTTVGVDGFIADPVTSGATFTRVFVKGAPALTNLVVTTGEVEALGASSINGGITFYCTWLPLTDGATLVAAA
jgi:hypothetical protein